MRIGNREIGGQARQIELSCFEAGVKRGVDAARDDGVAEFRLRDVQRDSAHGQRLGRALDFPQAEFRIDQFATRELEAAGDRLAARGILVDRQLRRVDLQIETLVAALAHRVERDAIECDLTSSEIDNELRRPGLEIIEQKPGHRARTAGRQAFDGELVVCGIGLELRRIKLDRTGFGAAPALGLERQFLRGDGLRLAVGGQLRRAELQLERFPIKSAARLERKSLRIDRQRIAIELEFSRGYLRIQPCKVLPRLALFCSLANRPCGPGLERRKRVLLLFQVEQDATDDIQLPGDRGFAALDLRGQVDLARHLVGDAAARQIELRKCNRLTAGLVAISNGSTAELDALDVKLQLVVLLFILGQQVIEIELAITPLDDIGNQAIDFDAVDQQLLLQQGQQVDIKLGALKLHELLVALELRQRHLTQLDPELGKHLERNVAGNAEGALLLLLHQLGDVVLEPVGVEGRTDDGDRNNQQGDQSARTDDQPFEDFHGFPSEGFT